ncbi:MAG: cation:proton antiporter [Kiritimatiellae bacterium]|nr:cation:proton antiporter [Kiritimatiellia bacterium]
MNFLLSFAREQPVQEPVALFAILMLIILVVPLICQLIRIPRIVGLIVAGIVLGPHALAILPEGGAVALLGKVGLIYIMFQAGLEIDMNEFEERRNQSLIFGFLSYAFPMVLGSVVIYVFLHNHLNHAHLWPTILLLASVFASHTLLSQPIVKRLDIMKDPAVTTAIGGTIVTDTLTLMTLAIIAAIVKGDANATFWTALFLGISVYTLALFLVVPRVSRWTFSKLKEGSIERFVYVLAIVFLCAMLAEVAKMEAIIGAFFAGLALNRLVPMRSPLAVRIQFVGESLFIPMFMISVGMIVDINSLLDPKMWGVAGVILLAVFVTKIIAVFGSARLFRFSFDQAMLVFGLCVSQAAATLAATFIGYEIGLFNNTILDSIIILILVTCLLSPWITERWGRAVALQAEARAGDPANAPQRLLVPLANPSTIGPLMAMATLLHDPKSEEPLFPLTVVRKNDTTEVQVAQAEKKLEEAVHLAVEANLDAVPVTRIDINIADGILRALDELRIRTVLIGWNGHVTADHFIFGSVLDRLLDGSEQTIYVYRNACPISEYRRVVLIIPPFFNRLPDFHGVISDMCILADQLGAPLHVITPSHSRFASEATLNEIKPSASITWGELETWDSVLLNLHETVKPTNDFVVLLASRRRTIAWTRENDRLPRLFAMYFSKNSFMIAYLRNQRSPATALPDFDVNSRLAASINTFGPPIGLNATESDEAIREFTSTLPGNLASDNLAEKLIAATHAHSIRVIGRTALIDLHRTDFRRSFVAVANAQQDAINFSDLKKPIHQLWFLVTGNENTTSEHEALLSVMNRRLQLHNHDLHAINTLTDVRRVLKV